MRPLATRSVFINQFWAHQSIMLSFPLCRRHILEPQTDYSTHSPFLLQQQYAKADEKLFPVPSHDHKAFIRYPQICR